MAAPYDPWTGCYLGGNLGWGEAGKKIIDEEPGLEGVLRYQHTDSGLIEGGQLGCDRLVNNNWVFGIQGMFDGADISGSGLDPQNNALTWHSKNSWIAAVTGRIGYTIQPMALVYAKAGGAWVHDHNLLTFAGGTQSTPDKVMAGWTVGGGYEFKFAPNWSAFVEYNYISLSTKNREPFSTLGAVFPYDVHNKVQAVLVGINYRWASH